MARVRLKHALTHTAILVMLGLTGVACARRIPASQLVGAPQPIWSPPVAYPRWLMDLGVEGVVVLQGRVDTNGRVERGSVHVLRSTMREFEGPAIDVLMGTRFRPAERDGVPVRAMVEMPITFRVADSVVDSAAAAEALADGQRFAKVGNLELAVDAFTRARRLDMRLVSSTTIAWHLCWYGSLWHYAENVMSMCDWLVAMHPGSERARDARGVARALTGDFRGAIDDFQQVVAASTSEQVREERAEWIRLLRDRENPITSDVIVRLRETEP